MHSSSASAEHLATSNAGGSRSSVGTTSDGPKTETFWVRSGWWLRPTIITLYVMFVLIAAPLLIYNSIKDGFARDDQLILIGGLLVLATLPMSVWHIVQHMSHFHKPVLQKPIVRILWMVPIYATNAWVGLIFYEHSFYMDCVREIYEAYVIYNFMVYLLNYLNLEMDLERNLELKPQQPHTFPLCCMRPWRMGREFVHNCKHGILQYTVLRLFTTLIAIVCEAFDVYGESTFRTDVAYPYLVAINNVSQCTAMYCLVLFYMANRAELAPMKPLPKFLCIKAVIFFSFFQSVIITLLVYYGYVHNIFGATDASDADHKNLSSKLQDFLICIEMFFAALAHKYSFPHQPFHINIPNYTVASGRTWFQSCWAMCDVSDVHADVSDHFGVLGSSMVRRLRGHADYSMPRGANEADRLIPDQGGSMMRYQQPSPGASRHQQQQPSAGDSSRTGAQPQSGRYGSTSAASGGPSFTAYGAAAAPVVAVVGGGTHINIVAGGGGAADKEYSPQFGGGAPRRGGQWTGGSAASSMSLLQDMDDRMGGAHGHRDGYGAATRTTTSTRTTDSSSSLATSSHRGAGHRDTFTGLTTGAEGDGDGLGGMRHSDSAASDWLNTPTDDMCGLDVAGPDKEDLIQLRPDPSV